MFRRKGVLFSVLLALLLCACAAEVGTAQVGVDVPSDSPPAQSESAAPVQPEEEEPTTPQISDDLIESDPPQDDGPVMLSELVGLMPECEPVEESWFQDAVFIGDSRTDGLQLYGGIKGADYLCYNGLSVFSVDDKKCISKNGEQLTVLEALGQKVYGKVFVLLGINEIGYQYLDLFRAAYSELVDMIRAVQPEAVIYLQLNSPVNEEVAVKKKTYAHVTNERILLFNELITAVAEEQGTALIDLWSALVDETGELPADLTADGVHMLRAGYQCWADYLRTHTGTTPLVRERVASEGVDTPSREQD